MIQAASSINNIAVLFSSQMQKDQRYWLLFPSNRIYPFALWHDSFGRVICLGSVKYDQHKSIYSGTTFKWRDAGFASADAYGFLHRSLDIDGADSGSLQFFQRVYNFINHKSSYISLDKLHERPPFMDYFSKISFHKNSLQ